LASRRPPGASYGDLEVDCTRHLAQRDGRRLGLGPKEFGVLELLLSSQGRVLSAEELLEHVWDEHADPFTKTVSMTLSRSRAKLGTRPSSIQCPSPATGWPRANDVAPEAARRSALGGAYASAQWRLTSARWPGESST
jgi:hypothetical protein